MKKLVFLFLFLHITLLSFSQIGRPYAIWEDQVAGVYRYVQLDANTGTKTNIAPIPGILGFVAGNISCFNTANNYYHFAALSGSGLILLYTLDAFSGAVIYNPIMTDNIIGIEYNCSNSTLYALRENSNIYDIVSIDPVTGTATAVAPIGFLNGHVGGSFSLNTQLGHYSFIALTGSGYVLKTFNIATGLSVSSVAFPDNVLGHKYSCFDNALYGLWEDAGVYKVERIDPIMGTHTTVGTLTGVTPGFVLESQSVDENGYYTFRGFDSLNNFALFTVDLSTAVITATAPTSENAVGFEEFNCCSMPTTINDLGKKRLFSVFPVPANDEITIQPEDSIDWIEINATDGKQMLIFKNISQNTHISTSGWISGFYIIRAGNRNSVFVQKISIQ